MSGDKIDCDLPVKFSKVKSRSPQRNQSTRLDEFTEEVFLPLVAGDEFQEQELDGNFIFFVLVLCYVILSLLFVVFPSYLLQADTKATLFIGRHGIALSSCEL